MTYGLVAAFSHRGQQGWQVNKLGAGGFISGVDCHADGTKVCRADSGGAYLWNATTSTWNRIVSVSSMGAPNVDADVSNPNITTNGVYEIRIAPSNSSRLYMHYIGYIFRSDNKGTTWTNITRGVTGAPPQAFLWFTEANDTNYRSNGPKLAIDPANADVVVVGTAADGLWYTQDAGATWAKISGVTDSTTGGFTVAYDPSSSVVSGKTQGIYAASYGQGVYHTATGPSGTWSSVTATGVPTLVVALNVAADGKLFAINKDVPQTFHTLTGGAAGTWATVSPGSAAPLGIALNPSNSAQVWVSESNGHISYSSDHGVTFSGYSGSHSFTAPTITWLNTLGGTPFAMQPGFGSMTYDPADTKLILGYGAGIASATPPTSASLVAWTDFAQGIEELIGTQVLKPPGLRPILSGWDMGVFRSVSPETYPTKKWISDNSAGISAAWCTDFCPTDPNTIVARIHFSGAETSGKSTDGGLNWTQFAGRADYAGDGNIGGNIACGSDPLNYVLIKTDSGPSNNRPFYTLDGGATWTPITISGVSATGPTGWNANYTGRIFNLCSDRVDADTFYLYNTGNGGNTGGIYISTNKGVSWTLKKAITFPSGSGAANYRFVSVPGKSGELFFTNGITGNASQPAPQRSTDHGATWTALTTCGEVWCIGFGKAKPGGGGYPAIFIVGFVSSVFGIWRSDDNAATWNHVDAASDAGPNNNFDLISNITGDPDVYGDCWITRYDSGFDYFRFS